MSVADPGKAIGQFAGIPGSRSKRLNKASGITITRGLLVKPDTSTAPDSYVSAAAAVNQFGPLYMPVETKGAGTTEFSVRVNDVCYLTADGVIDPGQKVQASTTTAGQVVAFVPSTVSATPTQAEVQNVRDDRTRQVGICLGTADTYDTGSPAAAADGDIVAVFIPEGGY